MMRRRFTILSLLALCASILNAEDFRTWNVIDGGYFEAKLKSVETTHVFMENREGDTTKFPMADLKPSDRDYVRDWVAAQAPSRGLSVQTDFAQKVYKSLVHYDGEKLAPFEPKTSIESKYFAFYESALWCPLCHKFTPKLVRFYNEQKEQGAPFELIFISYDINKKAMVEFMGKYKMPFPAFKYKQNRDIVSSGRGVPNLIVTDANGKKLFDNYDESGEYIDPSDVLEELEKLLEK